MGVPLQRWAFARELRSNATDAERRLWKSLRQRRFAGHKFRRPQPLGPYIADFFCLEARLVVEVDGSQHYAQQAAYDRERDRWLRSRGFRVLRFSDGEVLSEIDSVETMIWQAIEENPHPNPPP